MTKAEQGFPDIVGEWYDYKVGQYKQTPCHSNRASQLGGSCTRELVYWRTSWEEAEAVPDEVKVIFAEGNKHEEAILIELRKAGLTILEQQVPLHWREYQITGHLDAIVLHDGGACIPIDIKSMAPWIWDSTFPRGAGLYTWAEVAEAFQKRPWLKKYLGQMLLYMLLKNVDRGALLCVNKSTGAMSQVNIPLDYDAAEELLKRAEEINRHVDDDTLPERIPFDLDTCPRCPFYSTCLPEYQGQEPLKFVPDVQIETACDQRAEVAPGRDFSKLDKMVKDWAKLQPDANLVVGKWLLKKRPHGKGVRVDISPAAEVEGIEV